MVARPYLCHRTYPLITIHLNNPLSIMQHIMNIIPHSTHFYTVSAVLILERHNLPQLPRLHLQMPHVEAHQAAQQEQESKGHYSGSYQTEVDPVDCQYTHRILGLVGVLPQQSTIQPREQTSVWVEYRTEVLSDCQIVVDMSEQCAHIAVHVVPESVTGGFCLGIEPARQFGVVCAIDLTIADVVVHHLHVVVIVIHEVSCEVGAGPAVSSVGVRGKRGNVSFSVVVVHNREGVDTARGGTCGDLIDAIRAG